LDKALSENHVIGQNLLDQVAELSVHVVSVPEQRERILLDVRAKLILIHQDVMSVRLLPQKDH
jgi:hypothetical protein